MEVSVSAPGGNYEEHMLEAIRLGVVNYLDRNKLDGLRDVKAVLVEDTIGMAMRMEALVYAERRGEQLVPVTVHYDDVETLVFVERHRIWWRPWKWDTTTTVRTRKAKRVRQVVERVQVYDAYPESTLSTPVLGAPVRFASYY